MGARHSIISYSRLINSAGDVERARTLSSVACLTLRSLLKLINSSFSPFLTPSARFSNSASATSLSRVARSYFSNVNLEVPIDWKRAETITEVQAIPLPTIPLPSFSLSSDAALFSLFRNLTVSCSTLNAVASAKTRPRDARRVVVSSEESWERHTLARRTRDVNVVRHELFRQFTV